ncbi:TetR/AcrR family transcriptional regulator [Aquibium carbonis]|uniref:TetR/AcrR family transcriptional regulator n=1 Tax=Aquibium carbonis TaxID=2495581 RepID=A0A429Z1Y3_9HYPH|nr:helix-turn-helix domain-containing protein [Aquibium carbonis]RST87716.1 TetR/AcrR family transcriptional regulator [Aquibium carbonis]
MNRSNTTVANQDQAAPDPTREKIKAAAQRLFSARGIDGVSVRDIVAAAGLRNGASLHYYFGSKEGLLRELVVDGARRSDSARRRALEELERAGGPVTVTDVVRILIDVETGGRNEPEAGPSVGFGHMRFIVALQINHRAMLGEALDGVQNTGYLRCIAHIRKLLPNLPPHIVNQRLIFMYILLTTALAAREAAFEADVGGGKLWSSPDALENLIASITGMLTAPFPN